MVTCALDNEVSGELLGLKLPDWQALLLHRVLPSCGGLIVYLTVVCFDSALIYEHLQNDERRVGIFCIILMVLPALLSLIFTLASPPPGLVSEHSACCWNIQTKNLKWIAWQFVNFIFFPIAAIGRYCFQIFWWVEAICAVRAEDQERTDEALAVARAPSPLELYLFLQAFVHSAPHAILNILNLMAKTQDPLYEKVTVQAVSIIAATVRMASVTAVYRRFAREKICGRKYPWVNPQDDVDNAINTALEQEKDVKDEPIYETINIAIETNEAVNSELVSKETSRMNSDLIQFSPRSTAVSPLFFDNYSDTSSEYMTPIPVDRRTSGYNSDDDYVKPLTIIDRIAPKRRDTHYTIERVQVTPPPAVPAPRPGSLAVWAEKLVENAESIPAWLSAPPRYKYYREVIPDEPDVPRRVPIPFVRGLEPPDLTASLVHFLGWYSFFVARLISIAAFINVFPIAAIITLFSHYQVMLLFLIVPNATKVKRFFYIFLAFIYLFCLMEFKIRFRHVRVWHVFWIIVCTIETVVFTSLWATIDNYFGGWWVAFTVQVIIGSLMLSYMCFLVYFVVLKPRETIVYTKNKSTDE